MRLGIDDFDSGESSVDHWLQTRAIKNQSSGASRTYVVCEQTKVVGFYSLSASSVERSRASGRHTRNMPDPIPVLLLGQLAVARSHQRAGIARALIRDALIRSISTSRGVGVAAVIVDALTDELVEFYSKFGFVSISDAEPHTMIVRIRDIAAVLS